ncbi:hypothetical protein [Mangrovicoccus ximenensis]|uniref:hypothetical protein n=1 Tax=Mangrovicoccus ximenensis TaxID=1911570 RepID=UPI000D35186C|nr:hypothetical protein [Mangrovicoccus ximenensis]
MTDRLPTNWTSRDDAMVESAIRRGATRRDLLRMLMASGVTLAAGGTLLGSATWNERPDAPESAAAATAACLSPLRAASRRANDLSGGNRFPRHINDVAASKSRLRIAAFPHFDMRP